MTGGSLKVLVTGASGFIGRRCLERLIAAGLEVHAVTSPSGSVVTDSPGVDWHRVDLLDVHQCDSLVAQTEPHYLLHAAWIATPGVFWTSPENLAWLASTATLVRSFYARGGVRAVGVGTCAEYEWGEEDCRERSTPLRPSTAYGQCKLAACLAFEAAAVSHSRGWAWARLFFPYGPGEPPKRLIPAVIDAMLRGAPIDCTEGRQVRDFVFVDDIADALVRLLLHEANGVFNVGSGKGRSLRDIVALLGERIGGLDLVRFGARTAPPDDPARVVADVGRLQNELGWKPACSIEAGLDRTIAEARRALAHDQGRQDAIHH